MGKGAWTSAILTAVTIVAVVPRLVFAQPAAVAPSRNDVEAQASILADSNATPELRDEAARRLVSRRTPQSRQSIVAILVDAGNPQSQIAVARALGDNPDLDPSFIDPLFVILQTSRASDAAAAALANYRNRPDVLTRLAERAASRQPDPIRRAAIGAIGRFPEKTAARVLIDLLMRDDESPVIRTAADDALAALTGSGSQDMQRWQDWWDANAKKTDQQFREDVLAERAGRFDALRLKNKELTDALDAALTNQYRISQNKPELLMQYLTSPYAENRAVGATILLLEKVEAGRDASPEALVQLRQMVGDSDANVRLKVAQTLARLNDSKALEPLLAQIALETDPGVRAALAQALGPIGDLRAVPELIKLLSDPSMAVARAGADAISRLASRLHDVDPPRAAEAAAKLRLLLARTSPNKPGTVELRASVVDAMAELRDPSLIDALRPLLTKSESLPVRRNAIKGIGNLKDKKAADAIVEFLKDKEPGVQLQAVQALSDMNAFEYAKNLADLLPPRAADESVQSLAWDTFQSFLPNIKEDQLYQFADQFRSDPRRRIAVLARLSEVLQNANKLDELADEKLNMGDTFVELGRFDEASINYDLALRQKEQTSAPDVVIVGLTEKRMSALLRSGKYAEAMQFASEWIKKDRRKQQNMFAEIRTECERLLKEYSDTNDKQSLTNADNLMKAATKALDPTLLERYRADMDDIRSRVVKFQAEKGSELPVPSSGITARTDR